MHGRWPSDQRQPTRPGRRDLVAAVHFRAAGTRALEVAVCARPGAGSWELDQCTPSTKQAHANTGSAYCATPALRCPPSVCHEQLIFRRPPPPHSCLSSTRASIMGLAPKHKHGKGAQRQWFRSTESVIDSQRCSTATAMGGALRISAGVAGNGNGTLVRGLHRAPWSQFNPICWLVMRARSPGCPPRCLLGHACRQRSH